MKATILAGIFSFLALAIFSQTRQFQTYSAAITISAFKDGENYRWQNKNIQVRLDYKIGNFITRLTNNHFTDISQTPAAVSDSTGEQLEYTFTGHFPVNEIKDQKQIKRNYQVELLINCDALSLREPVLFDMQVTRPSQGNQGSYIIFSLHGKLDNSVLDLPAFKGFDDEIEIEVKSEWEQSAPTGEKRIHISDGQSEQELQSMVYEGLVMAGIFDSTRDKE